MRGIPILPPAVAAVSIDDPSRIDLGPLAHIDGGSAPAIAYPAPQPEPPTSPPSGGLLGGLLSPISLTLPLPLPTLSLPGLLVTGTPAALPRVSYEASPPDVFSMQLDQLKSLADYVFEAGDEGAAGARLRGTGGDGNAAAVGAALPLPPQGGGASGGSARGVDRQAETTTASGRAPQGLLSWVTSVVENVGALTSATPTAVVPRLSSTVSTVGIAAVNALGWADAGNARIAAGVGQAPVRTAPRLLRGRAVFVDGGLVLDATTPLEGRALLVVRGDLTVQDGNVSDLQGLVYVTGDAVIDGDFRLAGSLIVRGSLQMGYGSQPVTIQYSQTAIDMLKKDLERYRLSRSIRPGWAR